MPKNPAKSIYPREGDKTLTVLVNWYEQEAETFKFLYNSYDMNYHMAVREVSAYLKQYRSFNPAHDKFFVVNDDVPMIVFEVKPDA